MAKTIEGNQADRDKYNVVTKLLRLEDLDVVNQKYDEKEQTHEIYCVARFDIALCPECSHISSKVHDYPQQRWIHDSPLRGQKMILIFDSRRFKCCYCGTVFTQKVRDVAPDCTYTNRLYEEIANPKRKQDVSTISELYGIGYKVVESIFHKAGEAKLEKRRQNPLFVSQLGVDEISQKKGRVTTF